MNMTNFLPFDERIEAKIKDTTPAHLTWPQRKRVRVVKWLVRTWLTKKDRAFFYDTIHGVSTPKLSELYGLKGSRLARDKQKAIIKKVSKLYENRKLLNKLLLLKKWRYHRETLAFVGLLTIPEVIQKLEVKLTVPGMRERIKKGLANLYTKLQKKDCKELKIFARRRKCL